MPKDEIISMVLEIYDARKEVKEYLEFYTNPDEDGKREEYKNIIIEEFYPSKWWQDPMTCFVVCRKAFSDCKKLKPLADKLANLMLCYVENACKFTYDYGDMWEQYFTYETMCGMGFSMWMRIFRYNCRLISCALPRRWLTANTTEWLFFHDRKSHSFLYYIRMRTRTICSATIWTYYQDNVLHGHIA